MATLPDLPTNEILIMGYWNCSTAGFDPPTDLTPLVEYTNVVSYEIADNGVDLVVSESISDMLEAQEYHVRYKSDGWLIVWIDRDTNYAANDAGAGLHQLLNNVAGTTLPMTTLVTELQQIWGQFPVGAPGDIAAADVAYHYPPNANATTLTVGNGQVSADGATLDAGFSYDPSAALYEVVAAGRGYQHSDTSTAWAEFNGNRFMSSSRYSNGSVDVLAQGLAPDPGTVYPVRAYCTDSAQGGRSEVAVVTVWS